MVEFIGIKRPASHAGEMGIFPAAEMFEEDMQAVPNGVDANVVVTIKATLKYNRASWFLAKLVADACDWLDDKDDAREALLIEAKHYRKYYDKLRDRVELRAKPTRTLDATDWIRLLRRMVDRANAVFVPNDPDSPFRQELNRFMDPLFEPERPKGEEPPPITEIPEGPGHNSGPSGVDRDLDRPEPRAEPTRRRPPPGGSETPAEPKAAPEPPLARETASAPDPKEGYPAYALWHFDRLQSQEAAMEWLWTPEQARLRDSLLVPIGVRKSLEREAAARFGGKA